MRILEQATLSLKILLVCTIGGVPYRFLSHSSKLYTDLEKSQFCSLHRDTLNLRNKRTECYLVSWLEFCEIFESDYLIGSWYLYRQGENLSPSLLSSIAGGIPWLRVKSYHLCLRHFIFLLLVFLYAKFQSSSLLQRHALKDLSPIE